MVIIPEHPGNGWEYKGNKIHPPSAYGDVYTGDKFTSGLNDFVVAANRVIHLKSKTFYVIVKELNRRCKEL